MKTRRSLAAVAAAVTGVMLLAACGAGATADEPADNGTQAEAPAPEAEAPEAPEGTGAEPTGHLRLASMAIPPSWDVNGRSIGHDMTIMTAVFDTILRWGPDGSVQPGLAESWDMSDDRLTITLEIRDGVSFTDGTPVDGEAVAANIQHFMESSARNLSHADHIAGATADGMTVTIEMTEPDPVILRNLGGPLGMISSPASWDNPDAATNPVGSGPYILDVENSTPGFEYTVVPNPDYWDDSFDRFERVTLTFFEDVTAMNNAILGGQVDVSNVWGDTGVIPQFEAAGFNTADIVLDWFGLLIYDRHGELVPELADVRVRQAINYALDREGINTVFNHGRGQVTNQIFGPATTGFVEDLLDRYPHDPDRARELIAEAGAEGTVIPFLTGPAFDQAMIASVQQQLEEVGLTIELHAAAPGELFNDLQTGRYALMPMWLSTTDTWQQAQYTVASTGLFNPFGSQDPQVDEYLEVIRAGSEAEAAQAARDLSAWMVENAWFAPIYFNMTTAVYADWISYVPTAINVMAPIYLIQPAG